MDRRRWLGYGALTLVVSIGCCCLGMWQFARRNEAVTENLRVENNYDATPIPLSDALASRTSFNDELKWQPVRLQGTYLHDDELLARNRPFAGQPGFDVLTPLLLPDGTVFIVDRGWIPTGSTRDTPDFIPPAPAGLVTVIARLKPSEPTIPGRGAAGNQVATIQLDEIADRLESDTFTGAYGLLVSENPEPRERPLAAGRPTPDEGPHLSYAFQWFVFAALAVGGFIYLGVSERRQRTGEVRRPRRRSRTRLNDADIEDRILDARSL